MSSTTDHRLQAAQRSIQIATRQAYTALISSSEAIVNVDPSTAGNNDDSNTSSNDSDNNRAGMDLGLKLFGTSQSYRTQIENEFHNKLQSVEKELADIQLSLKSLHNTGGTGTGSSGGGVGSSRDSRGEQLVERDDVMPTDDDDDKDSPISSINDIAQLQAHISFLQQCAKARKLLEDVDTLSLQTNFATSSSSSSSSERAGSNSVSSIYSPSSICSPSDFMRFAFNVDDDGKGSRDATVSPMVQAAQLVNEAYELLDNVAEGVSNQYAVYGEDDNASDAAAVGAQHHGIMQMQSKMLHELQHQARRKKMELRHRAMTIVESCIVVELEEKGRLLVRGSGTTTVDSTSANKKSVTFDIVESPIPASTSTPTNNDETVSTIPPPSPLSDAYQVLHIFSDANFPSFGETVDGAMKRLSAKLLSVLHPCLQKLEEHTPATGGKEVGYYKFTQESLKSVRSAESRYDPVSIKGTAVQLQWSLVGVPVLNKGDNAGTSAAARDSLATAEAIDEMKIRSLSAEISSSAVAFLSSLNFITNLFTFIYQHVLLRRSDLAQMLGKHLFGTYPLPNTTIESGSAVLSGGILVGAAAHGLESGEEMPLMYELVKSIRRHCISADNSLKIWQLLQKMEQCLVMEVASFENKLVELGLMKYATASASVVPNAAVSATSPTGLSVLLTDDDIAHSPNTSALDTSLSSLTPHSEHTRQNQVISPLSELANSLRHAYVEGQRSLILNQGRSILLNTDYHNTVQVGTFVPEPSDAGTLASLDDDPLKAFAFHQCSISTTAQQILSLCRKTMDDATNPDVASDLVDDALPPMLFRAARELLDLFRAIIPTSHSNEIGSIPRMAAVLHNDCVYLAHESSLLGAEYMGKFRRLNLDKNTKSKTRLLGEICSFMDMVPPFRDLATKSMGSMIEVQKGQLFELVSPRLTSFEQALSSNESVTEWDDADTALRASLYHLRHLSQAWKQVLARDVYHMSMGNLIDLVLVLFVDPVLKAGDITESASRFVHSLFLDATRGAADLFLVDSTPDNTSINDHVSQKITDGTSTDFRQQRNFHVAKKYSNLFDKAQAVGQFMCMRLDEIQRGLEEGVFRSVTARELSHLIIAAFDDSRKRATLLNELASR